MKARSRMFSLWRLAAAAMIAAAAGLATPAFAQQSVVVGIDLTTESFDPTGASSGVRTYLNQLAGGGALDGGVITAVAITSRTLTQPTILAKAALPSYPGIKQKGRSRALEQFQQDLVGQLQRLITEKDRNSLIKQSRIIDFFSLAETIFQQHRTPVKSRRMYIVSDMLQVDDQRNFERDREIKASGLSIPSLGGEIAIYGVSSSKYRDGERWRKVRELWLGLLAQAGIKISTYSSSPF